MRKSIKIPLIILLTLFLTILLGAGSYLLYVFHNTYRLPDSLEQEISIPNPIPETILKKKSYKITTFNIGFGAYDDQFDFFMDDGFADPEGKKIIHGTHGKAVNKTSVIKNTNGAIKTILDLQPDFALFQEVDIKSSRSYKVNQQAMINLAFPAYAYTTAINYHCPFLFAPVFDPMGYANSEIMTLSKAAPENSVRRSLPLANSKIKNITDLDRCLMINRYKVNNSDKELVIINVHMSAYDKGGSIRKLQVEFLGNILKEEHEKENYVIIGGDYNHCLSAEGPDYFIKPDGGEITPTWVADWEVEYEGYTLASTIKGDDERKTGTCRNNTKPYDENWTYTCVVDGFIVSDNIIVKDVKNITSHAFKYSDHNPVLLEFELK